MTLNTTRPTGQMGSYGSGARVRSKILAKTSAAAISLLLMVGVAAADNSVSEYKIVSGDAAETLRDFAKQSGLQLIYSAEALEGVQTKALSGRMDRRQALEVLLQDSQLLFEFSGTDTVYIRPVETAEPRLLKTSAVQPAASSAAPSAARPSASAQETDTSSSSDGRPRRKKDEIVVTAQKREQSLQDVPLSITAYTGDKLREMGVDTFSEFGRMVPSVSFLELGPSNNQIFVRGINSDAGVATVGFYIDEMPVTDLRQPDPRLFDVERVEVLAGPQGTLYGEGSMGGTVKFITNKPQAESYEAAFEAEGHSVKDGDFGYAVNGMVNIPLIKDKLALRAVASYRDRAGWIDNITLGQEDVNNEEVVGARASLRAFLTDELTVTGTVHYQDVEINSDFAEFIPLDNQTTRGTPELTHDDYLLGNLVIEYEFPWATMTSSTSYFDRTSFLTRDLTDVAMSLGGTTGEFRAPIDYEIITEELRFVSPDTGTVSWIAGFFYKSRKEVRNTYVRVNDIPDSVASGFGLMGGDLVFADNVNNLTYKQFAFFGEATVKLTDQLSLTGGLRYFDEKQELDALNDSDFVGVPTPLTAMVANDTFTPKVVLAYEPNEDILFYALASRGFRSGGINADAIAAGAPVTFGHDTLWNYEVGAKTTFADGRVTLNLAGFYMDWNDTQLFQPPAPVSYVDNAGKAHSLGVEVQLSIDPVDEFHLGLSAGFNEAQLDEDALNGLEGDTFPHIPEWNLSGEAQYNFRVSNALNGYLRVDGQYVGDRPSYLSLSPFFGTEEAYFLGNAKLTIEAENWDISLFADNFANSRGVVVLLLNQNTITRVRPRTIGVSFGMHF